MSAPIVRLLMNKAREKALCTFQAKQCFPWLWPLLTWNLIVLKSHGPELSVFVQKAGLSFAQAFEL